jgi:hypothetical protein
VRAFIFSAGCNARVNYIRPVYIPDRPHTKNHRLTPGCSHGNQATYAKGCRCDECREAWRIYRAPKVLAYKRKQRAVAKLEKARALLREAGELR